LVREQILNSTCKRIILFSHTYRVLSTFEPNSGDNYHWFGSHK